MTGIDSVWKHFGSGHLRSDHLFQTLGALLGRGFTVTDRELDRFFGIRFRSPYAEHTFAKHRIRCRDKRSSSNGECFRETAQMRTQVRCLFRNGLVQLIAELSPKSLHLRLEGRRDRQCFSGTKRSSCSRTYQCCKFIFFNLGSWSRIVSSTAKQRIE